MAKVVYEEKSHRLFFPSYFKIYEDKLEVFFWPFRYEIPFNEIKNIRLVERIPWYVGWGLRLNPFSRTLYFAIHHGKSVEIQKEGGYWKKIILSVKQPEKFISIAKRYL
jgi:hypothetical protein